MTMSASPLRAASRWLDASRSTSSTRTPTPASCAWIACATRDNSTFVPVRHSRTSIPSEYPASARSVRAAAGSYPYPRRVVSLPASPAVMAPCASTPRPPYSLSRTSDRFLRRVAGRRRRHDARHGHREELGKDGERLGEGEPDTRVPEDGNAAHVGRAPGSVRFSPGDGVERPGPAALGGRGQDP